MKWHIDQTKLFWYNKLVRYILCEPYGIRYEGYYLNCKLHRTDGPAVIDTYANGVIAREEYYLNGKCHNTNGPAFSGWLSDGTPSYCLYYLNDINYSRKMFKIILNKQSSTT